MVCNFTSPVKKYLLKTIELLGNYLILLKLLRQCLLARGLHYKASLSDWYWTNSDVLYVKIFASVGKFSALHVLNWQGREMNSFLLTKAA